MRARVSVSSAARPASKPSSSRRSTTAAPKARLSSSSRSLATFSQKRYASNQAKTESKPAQSDRGTEAFKGLLKDDGNLSPESLRKGFEKFSARGLTYHTAKQPVRVTVTGASGAIGYASLFRIASGDMLGKDQPVILQLLELPNAMKALEGVVMELQDCAFPLLKGITTTSTPETAFEGSHYALLIGAKPRTKGMERGDLLKENAAIFSVQGKAINKVADKNVKVLVVGNPANTNALIAAANAPDLNPSQFMAMTKLDHNRGLSQLALKTNTPVDKIERFAIWGNHSATQYPDISHTLLNGKSAKSVINDDKWVKDTFIPVVQQRGAAIIAARGASSAASAGGAAIEHMKEWAYGTEGKWTSWAVHSKGEYGSHPGLFFSFPIIAEEGGYFGIVKDLPIDPFSAERLTATNKELLSERDAVKDQLP